MQEEICWEDGYYIGLKEAIHALIMSLHDEVSVVEVIKSLAAQRDAIRSRIDSREDDC